MSTTTSDEAYQLVDVDLISQNPDNVRATYTNVDKLADSIEEHGLLQNLVLRPKGEGFVVMAGSRRFEALKLLNSPERKPKVKRPRYTRGMPVPALIREASSGASFENIVENVHREDVPYWDLGFRYLEWIDSGMTQADIANRVKKNAGHISLCCAIAKGLHPQVVSYLRESCPKVKVPLMTLVGISRLQTKAQQPNGPRQLAAIKHYIETPHQRGRRRGSTTINARFKVLQRAQVPPRHYHTYCVLMNYLAGRTTEPAWTSEEPFS